MKEINPSSRLGSHWGEVWGYEFMWDGQGKASKKEDCVAMGMMKTENLGKNIPDKGIARAKAMW